MPELALFYGIRVTMYFKDHQPPHFHVSYADKQAAIDIEKVCVLSGGLPNRQLRLVLAWCTLHQDELMQDWELARDGKPLNKIPPLI